jgi:hypothetical protein
MEARKQNYRNQEKDEGGADHKFDGKIWQHTKSDKAELEEGRHQDTEELTTEELEAIQEAADQLCNR